jgi:hypothetical protein
VEAHCDAGNVDCHWERTAMAAQTDETRAMIATLAGSQALLLDTLRRRGSIGQEDIDYILAVTEQGIAKAVDTAGPKAVVEMIKLCLQQLATSESRSPNTPCSKSADRKRD